VSGNDESMVNILVERVTNLKEQIVHQALEYERRLTELNHAHARAAEDKNKYVSAELFYAKIDELIKRQTEFEQWRAKVLGIAIGVGAVSGGTVGLVLNLLK
jgi:hypothetical protein